MNPPTCPIPHQQRLKSRRKASLLTILRNLQELKFTAVDLLMTIVDGNSDFEGFRNALFSPKNCASLVELLEQLIQDDKGKPIVNKWVSSHALHLVCEKVHVKMEAVKPHLWMHTTEVSPEFIERWDIHQIMEPILKAAGESKVSVAKPKSAKSKNRFTALLIIMVQIHYLHSWNFARVQIGLGLQAWACGTSRQMIDILHRTGLMVLYKSISNLVLKLADCSIERVKAALLLPHTLAYNNVNISSSIYVKQGPNTMSKVQSGTFGVIYELLNARAEDMSIEPLVDNMWHSSPLALSDLRMTPQARQSYILQTTVTIVQILMKYVKGFETQQSDTTLQHPKRRPLLVGHKTIFHPLQASTIEEASIDGNGNLLVHADDVSYWERREVFQLVFGSFHLAMNLLWCVLKTHHGTVKQTGSTACKPGLTQLFAILEKTQLGGEHPDYHMLLSALMQILHVLVLNTWRTECAYSLLAAFAKAGPMPRDLLDCARCIIERHTACWPTPRRVCRRLACSHMANIVHNNIVLLTCDLLYVAELIDAIATGDFSQVEDILPALMCMFRGSGSNNYLVEILHLCHDHRSC
ncbi:hypothetical protein EDB85DRAFT_1869407 [Lactarius pseudohatsudake]|nr:hypothetical protein EDB85DRAFT_1869407 [Lactarius pseudohatsudake]